MGKMDFKSFKFKLKSLTEDGEFEGYASVFGVKDEVDDIVMKGAFKKTLQEKKRFPLLAHHKIDTVIGYVEAEEDEYGLKVKGKLELGIQAAKEMYLLLKNKIISGLSIGYKVIKQEWDKSGTIRLLKELKLYEVSLVTFPANTFAEVTDVKAVVPFQDLPLADEGRRWDVNAARKRIIKFCGGPDKDNMDWAKFRKYHLWYDAKAPENITSYKFLIADVIDGKVYAIPRAIYASAAILQGARGGTNIPEDEQEKMKAHLEKYYKKLGKEPPWKRKELSLEEFVLGVAVTLQTHYNISGDEADKALTALDALIYKEPSDDTPEGVDEPQGLKDLAAELIKFKEVLNERTA